jgi:DNA replication protein DnaC
MNTDTLDKMKQMRLLGMHRAFTTSLQTAKNEILTADEMTALLVDTEWDERHNRSIERTTKNARFRYKATVEQLDYEGNRGLDKNKIHRLADGKYITQSENILITGPTGTGKSFLASALGQQACQGLKYSMLTLRVCSLNSRWLKLMAPPSGTCPRLKGRIC